MPLGSFWLLQEGVIQHIQTFDRSYHPYDNTIAMNVEFGMASQYILDLSKNVKRGLKTKAEKGLFPGPAPLGYLNDRNKPHGQRDLLVDPERFPLIRRMWDIMLEGNLTPPKILQLANESWGFRTPKGNPLSRSGIYKLFTNPLYYGWFEYPTDSGNWYKGIHQPMVTREEYDKVQIFLGRKGRPRPRILEFAFTGLIHCGECGGMITAEEKNHVVCSVCKHKFSSTHRVACPRCKIPIEKMKSPVVRHYVYYHCTKPKTKNCSQKSITDRTLEKQIVDLLKCFSISEHFRDWAIEQLRLESGKEFAHREQQMLSLRRAYDGCHKRLENLFKLRISPQNSDGQLLSDNDYAREKSALLIEKDRLQELLNENQGQTVRWMEDAEKVFIFACQAQKRFLNGSEKEKGDILAALGSNLVLQDKKLLFQVQKSVYLLKGLAARVPQVQAAFEPEIIGSNKRKLEQFYGQNPQVLAFVDDVRTFFRKKYFESKLKTVPLSHGRNQHACKDHANDLEMVWL